MEKRKAELLALPSATVIFANVYFLNFLRAPARPTKPEPSKNMVAGSGMGSTPIEEIATCP